MLRINIKVAFEIMYIKQTLTCVSTASNGMDFTAVTNSCADKAVVPLLPTEFVAKCIISHMK